MEIGVESTEKVNFNPPIENNPEIIAAMSMAVIEVENYYQSLFRQVLMTPGQQAVPESVLAFAFGTNGVDFERSGEIPVRPTKTGESLDRMAVEDPTIVKVGERYYVFHSAVSPKETGPGVQVAIQVVEGNSLTQLESTKKTILTPKDVQNSLGEQVDMVKEPEFFFGKDGLWHIIYEHTGRGFSEIAIAESPSLTGPYRNHRPLLQVRPEKWDSQHLSPGPILFTSKGDCLMFYNGRGPKSAEDQTPSWSVGHVIIDAQTGTVSNRSESPIIRPPEEIGPGNQLIAFGNSVVMKERSNRLYYTVADKRSAVATLKIEGL